MLLQAAEAALRVAQHVTPGLGTDRGLADSERFRKIRTCTEVGLCCARCGIGCSDSGTR